MPDSIKTCCDYSSLTPHVGKQTFFLLRASLVSCPPSHLSHLLLFPHLHPLQHLTRTIQTDIMGKEQLPRASVKTPRHDPLHVQLMGPADDSLGKKPRAKAARSERKNKPDAVRAPYLLLIRLVQLSLSSNKISWTGLPDSWLLETPVVNHHLSIYTTAS